MSQSRIVDSNEAQPWKNIPLQRRHLSAVPLGQGGFLNLRILVGLFVILVGVFLALLGFGAFSAQAQQKYRFVLNSMDQLVPPGFDCAKIRELGIGKQENLRAGAIMIACGEAEGGSASPEHLFSQFVQELMQPAVYGTTD